MIKPKIKTILVFCAHSDDQIIGPGGTIAKYSKEGYQIYTYIFSYGVMSNPWLKEEYIKKLRIREAEQANKIIGGKHVEFFDLNEGKYIEEAKNKKIDLKLKNILRKRKPDKIFTHSLNDPHPDHRAVHKLVLEAYDSLKAKSEVYSFRIWNVIDFKHRNQPRFVSDISKTFKIKKKALDRFKSQKIAMLSLMWNFYLLSFLNGLFHGFKMAEVFQRIR